MAVYVPVVKQLTTSVATNIYTIPAEQTALLTYLSAVNLDASSRVMRFYVDGLCIFRETLAAGAYKLFPINGTIFPMRTGQLVQADVDVAAGSGSTGVQLTMAFRLLPAVDATVPIPGESDAAAQGWAAIARNWAQKIDGPVAGSEYSAAWHAARAQEAVVAAQLGQALAETASGKAGQWASSGFNSEVEPGLFSAYHYSEVAKNYAQQSSQLDVRTLNPVDFTANEYTLQASDLGKIMEVVTTGLTTPKIKIPPALISLGVSIYRPLTIINEGPVTLTIEAVTIATAVPPTRSNIQAQLINGGKSESGWAAVNPTRLFSVVHPFPSTLSGRCRIITVASGQPNTTVARSITERWRVAPGGGAWTSATALSNNGLAGDFSSGIFQGVFVSNIADNFVGGAVGGDFELETTFTGPFTGLNATSFVVGNLSTGGTPIAAFYAIQADTISVPITASNQMVIIVGCQRGRIADGSGLNPTNGLVPGTREAATHTSLGPQGDATDVNSFNNMATAVYSDLNPPNGVTRVYTASWLNATRSRSLCAIRIDGATAASAAITLLSSATGPYTLATNRMAWLFYGATGLKARLHVENA